MKTTIYYFTATGNSQQVAKILQKELQSELKPMSSNISTICSSEVIGFVFPTYFWGIPNIVDTFIANISIKSQNPYIFAVTTCTLYSGAALGMVAELLEKHNLNLSYGKSIHSVGNYIIEYNVNTKKIEKTLNKVKKQTEKVSQAILLKKRTQVRKPFYIQKKIYSGYHKRRTQDNLFSVDDSCISCGLCQKVCPAQNIVMEKSRPHYQHHCEHCLACVHWCPKKAIQFNSVTAKKNRYTNPYVSINELNK